MANGTCVSLKHGTIAVILYVGMNIISAYISRIMSNCMNNQLTISP